MKQNELNAFYEAAKNADEKRLEKIGTAAASALSDEQKKKIEKALSDPDYLKSILSSPKTKEIMDKLRGGKD